jgi:FkbM family methyltransferase
VRLPWGAILKINPAEVIGRAIWLKGIYDLIVTETLWRLADKSDVAVDAGANIGYMTSVLSIRAGIVHAFEPHPAVFKTLSENAHRWDNVRLYEKALSNQTGDAYLAVPSDHKSNEGLAFLADTGLKIRRIRLDALLTIDLLKLDVERHELQVLEGAGDLKIRDIIFEEHGEYPTRVTDYLERRGYVIYSLGQTFFGPKLYAPQEKPSRVWEAQSYLATLDASRAITRFKTRGWQCL